MIFDPDIGVTGPHPTVYDDAPRRRQDPAEAPPPLA